MTQQDPQKPAVSDPPQQFQATPAAPKAPLSEETIFDGSPSWFGRAKAFLLTWLIALLLVISPILLQVYDIAVPWWVTAGAILIALLLVIAQFAYHRTIRFRITSYRIDFERGLLTRRIDSLELWHADDLYFRQTLIERMMGVGSIDVISDDPSNPRLQLKSIHDARATFDRVKSCVLQAKRQRGLLQLDQP